MHDSDQEDENRLCFVTIFIACLVIPCASMEFSEFGQHRSNIVSSQPPVAEFHWRSLFQGPRHSPLGSQTFPRDTPTGWKWDFESDGIIDDITANPMYR